MGYWLWTERRRLVRRTAWEKEWNSLQKREERYLKRRESPRESGISRLLEDKVPKKLQGILDAAFLKGFDAVFSKGNAVIERTYSSERQRQDYKIREFAAAVRRDRKSLRAFSRTARGGSWINLAISAAEGVGLGVLGIGLPDIPLFLGVLLKSVYQIALSYGFEYASPEERHLILKIIETSLMDGEELRRADMGVNELMEHMAAKEDGGKSGQGDDGGKLRAEDGQNPDRQIKRTAEALSRELLYMKFIQGLPVVGVVGGIGDAVCLKKVTGYVEMKYRRRFLLRIKACM